MFGVDDRDCVREHVLELARADARVVAAAAVGGTAGDEPDRWSDLDLTFCVAAPELLGDVLAAWTASLVERFGAVHLFDLPAHGAVYRVLLLPGSLQVDLSFAPPPDFGRRGPRFRLLFGDAAEHPTPPPPAPRHLLGLAVHHAVRARLSVERGRALQAAYWIGAARDLALELACARFGLPSAHARGADDLPAALRARVPDALVGSLDRDALLGALAATVGLLLDECGAAPELEPSLRDLLRA